MELIKLTDLTAKRFKSILADVKKIEVTAYRGASHMCMLQECSSKQDIKDYCESEEVCIIHSQGFYMILSRFEVVDVATIKKLTRVNVEEIKSLVKAWFGKDSFTLDARSTTSYPLILESVRLGELTIHSESHWKWGSEKMVEITCSFN